MLTCHVLSVLSSSCISQVHFGVNSGATRFAIEHQAVNEATFRCPDEMGWKPQVRYIFQVFFFLLLLTLISILFSLIFNFTQKVPIIPADGGITNKREVFYNVFIVNVVQIFNYKRGCLVGFFISDSCYWILKGFSIQILQTSLPVEEITKALAAKGYEVMTSDDAGRFVCNYVYYHSLLFSEQNKTKSLFVHVPLFLTIDEETQMQFAASLLEVLATLY